MLHREKWVLFSRILVFKNTCFQESKPSVAMSKILSALGVVKTRNLSGYEFFRFNMTEVLCVPMSPIASYMDSTLINDHSSASNSYPNKLQDIQDRNADAASNLLHQN